MPLTQQKHYTVGYHDTENRHYEICEYAINSYNAMKQAKEDVPYLKEHPSFIGYCTNESALDSLYNIMAAGIPMGR
tara:strand:- start:755 stop:982 length:228 start_codon:yes stop_codon:yes gene_type:complete